MSALTAKVEALASWPDKWNGYDAVAPLPAAIAAAQRWLKRAEASVPPDASVTSDGDGNVVLEWWLSDRKYTVYVEPSAVDVVLVDGTSIDAFITCYTGVPA